jgi:hypothetical protein
MTSNSTTPSGYFTDQLENHLSKPVSITIGVISFLIALHLLIWGHRSFSWLRYEKNEKGAFLLSGGVGGVVAGGITGASLIALVMLLILSRQAAISLGGAGALVTLSLSFIIFAGLGGYWRWIGLASLPLLGSLSFTLLLSISFSPAILPRLVILLISLLLFILLAYISRTKRIALSTFSALGGAYYFTLAIDIFVQQGFIDGLSLLVSKNGVPASSDPIVLIDTALGRGMIATWWILSVISSIWQVYWGVEDADEVRLSNPHPYEIYTSADIS